MEIDKRNIFRKLLGRVIKTSVGDSGVKDEEGKLGPVTIYFTSTRPVSNYNSFIEESLRRGHQGFLIVAMSLNDLNGARSLAESFKGEDGIVLVKDNSDDRLNTADRGIVTLFRPTSNIRQREK